MRSVSADWNTIFADSNHITEFKAVINGKTYDHASIVSAKITKGLFAKSFGIGSACAASLEMTFMPDGAIPTMAEIDCYVRLNDNKQLIALVDEDGNDVYTDDGFLICSQYPSTTEWMPFGVFFIDTRATDASGWMSITAYDAMLKGEVSYLDNSGTYPMQMSSAVAFICSQMGIQQDSRNNIANYTIDYPAEIYTLREVLSYIAAASGGNFVIGDDGKLRLVKLSSPAATSDTPCGSHSILSTVKTVSRVTLQPDDKTKYTSGNDSGYELIADCPYATQAMTNSVAAALNGVTYIPFSAGSAMPNPALELGDSVKCNNVLSVMAGAVYTAGAGFLCDISAPIDDEINHEYEYKGKTATERALATAYSAIKKTTDNIQLEVNGKLDADDAQTLIDQRIDGISLSASAGTNSSTLTISANGVTIDSQLISMGYVVADSIQASNISGNITSGQIALYGDMTVYSDSSLYSAGGYLGYTPSTKDGSGGIHMASNGSEVRCTPYGAALEGSSGAKVVATNDINITSGYGGAVYLKPNGANATYQASDTEFFSYRQNNLGLPSYPWNAVYSATSAIQTSDRRKKKEISHKISKYDRFFDFLKPAFFKMRDGTSNRFHVGLIAQEVEEALGAAGLDSVDFAGFVKSPREKGGHDYALRYGEFIALLIDQVQRLKRRVEELEANNGK